MSYPKIAALLFILGLAFYGGYEYKGLQVDSQNLVIAQAVAIANQSFTDSQKTTSDKLQATLKDLATTTRALRSEKDKIIERPVYINVCLDGDGLLLANAAKSGSNTE
jgi:hypothetical protein